MGSLGKRTDPYWNAKYWVEYAGIQEAGFTEVSGLEAEIEVFEYQEGGNNLFTHKLAGRVKYPNVILKRGITTSDDLYIWFSVGAMGKVDRRNISIVLYDQDGSEVRRWNLTMAYPVKWTGPSFQSSSSSIAIESLELAHSGIVPQNPE